MKNLLIAICALVISSSALAESKATKYSDLEERDGLYFERKSQIPFTGKTINSHKAKKFTGTFKKGRRNGLWLYYHSNGQPEASGKYKDGKYHGYWTWHFPNGKLKSNGPFKDGKYDGYWVSYYKNGQLRWEGVYALGKKVGPWTSYYPDGQLVERSKYMYEQPGVQVGLFVKYHMNGKLMEQGQYMNGKKNGAWVFYEDDGTKRFYSSKFGTDEGTGIYKNGIKISE